MRYQAIANELKLDKNQIYKAFRDLLKTGRVKKISVGAYRLSDGVPVAIAPRPHRKHKGNGTPPAISETIPVETPVPSPSAATTDIENLVTELMEKIGALQPLLLLHKDLFTAIEKNTLELVEAIIDVKPRILGHPEMAEYQELKHIKQRAEKIAAIKRYPPSPSTRRAS